MTSFPVDTVGICVYPDVAEAGWTLRINGQELTSAPLTDTYFSFQLTYLFTLIQQSLLVQFIVEEGAVVADDHQAGDLVMHCGPHRSVAHQEVAVAHQADGNAAAAFQCECCADGQAETRADGFATPACITSAQTNSLRVNLN